MRLKRIWDKKERYNPRLTLDLLLHRFQGQRCKDPRDMVFCLLGLVNEGATVSADYSLSTEQIYQRIMICAVQSPDIRHPKELMDFHDLLRHILELPPVSLSYQRLRDVLAQ